MAPRKSSRLASKGFKTKPVKETLIIRDESSDSTQTPSQPQVSQERRSKKKADAVEVDQPNPATEQEQEKDSSPYESLDVTTPESDNKSNKGSNPKQDDDSESTEEVVAESKKKEESKKRKMASRSPTKMSERKKKKDGSSSKKRYRNIKILDNSFIDFSFFEKNGFFWNHWLDKIGCKNLCNLSNEVAGEIIKEFYDNLELLDGLILKSKIAGKKVKISRKDLISCFNMKDEKDDEYFVSVKKNDLFRDINDGIGNYVEKDVFNTEFSLLIHLLHKIVIDCLLPKNGSTTSINKDEAIVILAMKKNLKLDLPSMILKHLWRTKFNMPYGSMLMKLLKFKKVQLPENAKFPQNLKRIGEIVLMRMNINVKRKFWFAKDGAWYVHPKFSKRIFDWEKIKSAIEGEHLIPADSGSEGAKGKKNKEKLPPRRPGKEVLKEKKKKKPRIMTGGKFEIKEGVGNPQDTDSDTDSEGVSFKGPGETSKHHFKKAVLDLMQQRFSEMKDEVEHLLEDMFTDPSHGSVSSPPPPHDSVSSPPVADTGSPEQTASPPGSEIPPFTPPSPPHAPEPVSPSLHLIPVSQPSLPSEPEHTPQIILSEVLQEYLRSFNPTFHSPPPPESSNLPIVRFSARKKTTARKSVKPPPKKN